MKELLQQIENYDRQQQEQIRQYTQTSLCNQTKGKENTKVSS